MTHPTRAYNRAELDLLPPSVVMEAIRKNSVISMMSGAVINGLLDRDEHLTIPCRSYAAAVVEHNKNTQEVVDLVKYNSQFNTLSFYKKNLKIGGWDTLSTMYHTTNPFQGLTNPDGTQVTSVTREVLDAWKRGEVV